MAKNDDAPLIDKSPGVPLPANVTLTQEQFAQVMEALRPSPPPEPELDLSNDPNVWTWERLRVLLESGEMHEVTFIPDENVMIGWNGLYTWVCKDVDNVVSEAHYNVYMESRRATRQAYGNARDTLLKRVPRDESGAPMASFGVGLVGARE